jgi:glutaredoxin
MPRCMLINREKAVVVDVCEVEEFALGHVVGAKTYPWATWRKSWPGGQEQGLAADPGVRPWARVQAVRWPWPRSWAYEKAQVAGGGCAPGARLACRLKRPDTMRKCSHHASCQDVHHRDLPVLHPRQADCWPHGRERDRRDARRSGPRAARHMMELTGRRTVPQIFIGGTHVGGCDDLMALDARAAAPLAQRLMQRLHRWARGDNPR